MSQANRTAKIKVHISKPINYKFEHQGRLIDTIELAIYALERYKKRLEKA